MCHQNVQFYHTARPQRLQGLWERQIVVLTAGMSTGAVRQNVHFAIISCLQRPFKEFDITSSWPHRPRLTTAAQDLHMQHLQLRDHHHLSSRMAAATNGLQNQRIPAQMA